MSKATPSSCYNTSMKKWLFLFVLIIFLVPALYYVFFRSGSPASVKSLATAEPVASSSGTIGGLSFEYAGPFDGSTLDLIPNFKEKKTFSTIVSENSCKAAINAGFYTKEDLPVGYFKSNGAVLRNQKDSLLFDGFFTVNLLSTPRITRSLPVDELHLGLQLGPIIFENGSPVRLKIRNDSPERRMALVVDGNNQVYFLTVFGQSNQFFGPNLSDFPSEVEKWAKNKNIPIADAINLDGGSASAFFSPNISIAEISPVGGVLCSK